MRALRDIPTLIVLLSGPLSGSGFLGRILVVDTGTANLGIRHWRSEV